MQNDRPEGLTQIPVCSANSCATQGPENQMERQMLERQRNPANRQWGECKGEKRWSVLMEHQSLQEHYVR